MKTMPLGCLILAGLILSGPVAAQNDAEQERQDVLPFEVKIETYRQKDSDVMAFAVRLEQPFLAGEFEKNSYVRLKPLDDNAYLIYPKEARFQQKLAQFHGRLRGNGQTSLQLSYEVISENLDGSRRVDVRQASISVPIPTEPKGIEEIYQEWARQQNSHFADLLRYYPEQTFFEYVLLQSQDRYGVAPPEEFTRLLQRDTATTEEQLYGIFSGGLAVQQSLQRLNLGKGAEVGDLTVHISEIAAPRVNSPDYRRLLQQKREAGVEPQLHDVARLVPADQYFLHFNAAPAADTLVQLANDWGDGLLRLFTVSAEDHHLRQKYEQQLGLQLEGLAQLSREGVISELAVSGSDFFFAEGTDLTVLVRTQQADQLLATAGKWMEEVKAAHPEVAQRDFNYRGHRITARYTSERVVSSFQIQHDDYVVFSNSHVAIRKVIDTALGEAPSLQDALDYHYLSTIAPPSNDDEAAYFYASDAFLRRLVGPAFKIAEKRRRQAFNNLVMLNNASLFYRMEYDRSPTSLSDLVQGRFVDYAEILDPTGGGYTYDTENDTTDSSIYNRIKYLTPIVELDVLKVSAQERQQYDRYRQRYESFWGRVFDPIVVRMSLGDPIELETTILPFANSPIYDQMRASLDDRPQTLGTGNIAASSVTSLALVPGSQRVAEVLRSIPGVPETLAEDPTLTDLEWLGDRVSIHFQDDQTILEIDPSRLRTINGPITISPGQQAVVAAAVAATNLPVYVTVDIEDQEKAARFLDHLSSRIFLEQQNLVGLSTALDAYQLPDYQDHLVYALTYEIHAAKIRLFISLAGERMIAATQLETLHEAIDAADQPETGREAHAMMRVNVQAMKELRGDLQFYWNEKLRQAAHRNIMPIYVLMNLYHIPIDEVNELADAKYGVTYYCPGGGEYRYDAESDQVYSTVYGNRRNARQPLTVAEDTSFVRLMDSIEEIASWLRFTDDGLVATVQIKRAP